MFPMQKFPNRSPKSMDLPLRTLRRSEFSAVCDDCHKKHDPRRLVICVDGTLYNENGSIMDPSGTSNVHRIWQLIPRETRHQDSNGQGWQQLRANYVSGVGLHSGMRHAAANVISTVTGEGSNTGCSAKIKEVYKSCCSLCPSRDEIFMFGFSRGAFVVRAVAGMLQHLGSLRTNDRDFESVFKEAQKVWQDLRRGGTAMNKVDSFRTQNTRESPIIRFMGVFDTVQAYNDNGLNDIRQLKNVHHVRHAMAMLERRAQFKLERFTDETMSDFGNRSCQEAWFIGTHGNIGGACREDGLALWPLQWVLTEAQKFGLELAFTTSPGSLTKNPAHLVFPWLSASSNLGVPNVSSHMAHVSYSNGISVPFYDLKKTFQKPGFHPEVDEGSAIWKQFEERQIFRADGSLFQLTDQRDDFNRVFIHPSVYWMDNKRSDMIRCINVVPFVKQLRDSVNTVVPEDQIHWNVTEEIKSLQKLEKPRILVCGEAGVGKSSLINAVLGVEATETIDRSDSGTHDINQPLGSVHSPLLLHDSQGWQSGETENFQTIETFLEQRRKEHLLENQIHCVWFCCASTQARITKTHVDFLKLDFGHIPVLLIITKQDMMNSDVESRIITQFYKEYRVRNPLELPPDKQNEAKVRIDHRLQQTMNNIKEDWQKRIDRDVPKENELELKFEFFSNMSPWIFDSSPKLVSASESAMTSDRIRHIHGEAQKNRINRALEDAIHALVKYWSTNRSTLKLTDNEGRVKEFVTGAIKEVQNAFQYDGFDENHHPDLILNLLHCSTTERSIWRSIFTGLKNALSTIALFGGPRERWLVMATYGLSMMTGARNEALSFIPELVHVLLIFERIYWYHGGKINDIFIEGSCYYYLKKQTDVMKRVAAVQGWDMFLSQLSRSWEKNIVDGILRIVVNEFRFKYNHDETEQTDQTPTPLMPGTYIGGGL